MSEETNLNANAETNETRKLYELAINIVPNLIEEKAAEEFLAIKEQIKKVKAEIISDSAPQLIPLQYTMVKKIDSTNHKHDQAYFGWIKFMAEPDTIITLREELDLHENILRYLITITDPETNITAEVISSILNEKVKGGKKGESDEPEAEVLPAEEVTETEEVEEEVDTVAVDKAIDDLVEEAK